MVDLNTVARTQVTWVGHIKNALTAVLQIDDDAVARDLALVVAAARSFNRVTRCRATGHARSRGRHAAKTTTNLVANYTAHHRADDGTHAAGATRLRAQLFDLADRAVFHPIRRLLRVIYRCGVFTGFLN